MCVWRGSSVSVCAGGTLTCGSLEMCEVSLSICIVLYEYVCGGDTSMYQLHECIHTEHMYTDLH